MTVSVNNIVPIRTYVSANNISLKKICTRRRVHSHSHLLIRIYFCQQFCLSISFCNFFNGEIFKDILKVYLLMVVVDVVLRQITTVFSK